MLGSRSVVKNWSQSTWARLGRNLGTSLLTLAGIASFQPLAWHDQCCQNYVGEKPANWLWTGGEFFHSLWDLLVLSLDANLSFDSAEFLSQWLDHFKRTVSILSSRLQVSYPTEVQLLSDLNALLHIVSQQRQHCEDLSYFALHAEEEEQLWTARVGVLISGVPGRPRLDISENRLEVLRNQAEFRWATIAKNLHVSERTLWRWRDEFGFTSLTFSDIDNNSLDEIVREILHVTPRIGFRLVQGALCQRRITV